MPRRGLISIIGSGVGMAAEYREHRKEQKLSRENSQQDETAAAGPSTRPQLQHAPGSGSSTRDLPPAYSTAVDEKSERSLASGKSASSDKKAALAQYDDESSSDDDLSSLEDDEADWELDEAVERNDPPSYEESEENFVPVDELVQDVMTSNRAALAAAPAFDRTALPCPVILPQRRPRKKQRGFVRAYAPLLGECAGIDQETFLKFIDNFYKSSQASPIFPAIFIAATIAGFAPSAIAMAVTTVVQIAAQTAQEIQSRQRTNTFLDKMNEELFKPAGLYAMIVKYKSAEEVMQSGNSLLARFGVSGSKVDFNTNQAVARYDRTLSDESTSSRSMSDRLKGMRLASGETRGAIQLPECAPLIFPDVDKAIAREGPETFKDKAKDAKSFVADYMDRRAQREYAVNDPNSALAIPESQRAFKSKLADPSHPMYNGGIVGFVSGGYLTRDRGGMTRRQDKRFRRDERRALRYEQRMATGRYMSPMKQRRYDRIMAEEKFYGHERQQYGYGGQPGAYDPNYGRRPGPRGPLGLVGGLIGAATGGGRQNREYEDSYDNRLAPAPYGGETRRSFDERRNAPAPHAPYGGQQSYGGEYSYGSQQPYRPAGAGYAGYGGGSQYLTRDPRRGKGNRSSIIGGVKRIMREDVLYLMIVNMPSEAELAEARETLAKAKSKS